MAFRLPRIQFSLSIVNEKGQATSQFQKGINDAFSRIEVQEARQDLTLEQLQEAVAAIQAAQAAIEAAEEAVQVVQEAVVTVQDAVETATNAAESANNAIEQIETGDFDLQAVKVGGIKFINDGGSLVPE